MPTVYERIKANRFVTDPKLRSEIGKKIAEKYFELPPELRPPLSQKKSIEEEGEFIVWLYPTRFQKTMDLIIKSMCNGMPKNKRPRIKK